MTTEQRVEITFFTTTLCMPLIALLLVLDNPGRTTPAGLPERHVYILIVSFSLLTLLQHFRRDYRNPFLLVVRLLIAGLCNVYYRETVESVSLLYLTLIADVNFFFRRPSNIILSCLGVMVAIGIQYYYWHPLVEPSLPFLLATLPQLLLLMIVGMMASLLRSLSDALQAEIGIERRLRESVLNLTEANKGFLRYAHEAEVRAGREERMRITRDLHDVVGRSFTNIIMMLRAAGRNDSSENDETKRMHAWISETCSKGLDEVRDILYKLRQDDSKQGDFQRLIEDLAEAFARASDVHIDISWGNLPRFLPANICSILYGTIQEAMTNSFRHGRADWIGIYFWLTHGTLRLVAEDNGSGAEDAAAGIGQQGMLERIGSLGGTLRFANYEGGYRVSAELPLGGNLD